MLEAAAIAFVQSLTTPHLRPDAQSHAQAITCRPGPELARAMVAGGAPADLTVVFCTLPTACGTEVTLPYFHRPDVGLYSHAAPVWWTLGFDCPDMLTEAAMALHRAALADGGPIAEGPIYAN